ncbi:sugar phosphate phosphatase [Paenibacillus antibioticophila]|uniref:Sugar phosphate phosphatase n=1 Tax=Paenibacillus antibioticophila TaxID=1274374 RepID=A0A919XQ29_9BACL|nr:Cof-type HAD-IIB family hydrolase [Paenibacillus antibioticophila]GIO37157.1 sugar phosphate phosphatase [Paenibacillus antibioticophila]
MERNFKLIALDMDGTLLNDDHEISAGTVEIIQALAGQGVEFVLCTGRAPFSSIPYMQKMGLNGYVITHNGAATVGTRDERIVHEFGMTPQGLNPYIEYCREHGIHYDVNTTFSVYVPNAPGLSQEALDLYHRFLIDPLDLPAWEEFSEPIVKMTLTADMQQLDQVQSDWSVWAPEFNILRSGDFFIDIMHKEASKGAALKKLAEKRGLQAEQVMAIGNYYNDLSMLTYAGLGIAMDNSPVEVKAAAQALTATNNEEGVKLALEKYCLGN